MFSRKLAAAMYGPHRTYGYIYGGSGGAYRTLGSMENTEGVWDGAVPFVIGSPMAAPNSHTVRMHAMRVLEKKFPDIVDAMDAGGSGNPYATLTPVEADALHEVTRMGFSPRSWFGYKTMGVHAFPALYAGVLMADPTYFTDFFDKPGTYFVTLKVESERQGDTASPYARIQNLARARVVVKQPLSQPPRPTVGRRGLGVPKSSPDGLRRWK